MGSPKSRENVSNQANNDKIKDELELVGILTLY